MALDTKQSKLRRFLENSVERHDNIQLINVLILVYFRQESLDQHRGRTILLWTIEDAQIRGQFALQLHMTGKLEF